MKTVIDNCAFTETPLSKTQQVCLHHYSATINYPLSSTKEINLSSAQEITPCGLNDMIFLTTTYFAKSPMSAPITHVLKASIFDMIAEVPGYIFQGRCSRRRS